VYYLFINRQYLFSRLFQGNQGRNIRSGVEYTSEVTGSEFLTSLGRFSIIYYLNMIETIRKRLGYKLPRPATWLLRLLNYILPCHVETELFPGLNVLLNLKDDGQRYLYWRGRDYDAPLPQTLANWCEGGTAFFDIGANFGIYSYYILSACPGVSVYSFEPNPDLNATQIYMKYKNRLDRFYPQAIGLSDVETQLTLYLADRDSGHSTFVPPTVPENMTTARVTTFDQWCNEMELQPQPHAWVAKIDVEGFEVKVLQGMRQALQAHAFKGLCIEVNEPTLKTGGSSPQELFELMASFGYQALDTNLQPTECQPHEFRNVFFVLP
jgi:FkbM family methyltransferase